MGVIPTQFVFNTLTSYVIKYKFYDTVFPSVCSERLIIMVFNVPQFEELFCPIIVEGESSQEADQEQVDLL